MILQLKDTHECMLTHKEETHTQAVKKSRPDNGRPGQMSSLDLEDCVAWWQR